jgi:succinate dehydrogenase (ubiquinone) iron-sulfur subunit
MQVLAKTARASALRSCMRSFASAALEKPVLNKEFKIYRWVSKN